MPQRLFNKINKRKPSEIIQYVKSLTIAYKLKDEICSKADKAVVYKILNEILNKILRENKKDSTKRDQLINYYTTREDTKQNKLIKDNVDFNKLFKDLVIYKNLKVYYYTPNNKLLNVRMVDQSPTNKVDTSTPPLIDFINEVIKKLHPIQRHIKLISSNQTGNQVVTGNNISNPGVTTNNNINTCDYRNQILNYIYDVTQEFLMIERIIDLYIEYRSLHSIIGSNSISASIEPIYIKYKLTGMPPKLKTTLQKKLINITNYLTSLFNSYTNNKNKAICSKADEVVVNKILRVNKILLSKNLNKPDFETKQQQLINYLNKRSETKQNKDDMNFERFQDLVSRKNLNVYKQNNNLQVQMVDQLPNNNVDTSTPSLIDLINGVIKKLHPIQPHIKLISIYSNNSINIMNEEVLKEFIEKIVSVLSSQANNGSNIREGSESSNVSSFGWSKGEGERNTAGEGEGSTQALNPTSLTMSNGQKTESNA